MQNANAYASVVKSNLILDARCRHNAEKKKKKKKHIGNVLFAINLRTSFNRGG